VRRELRSLLVVATCFALGLACGFVAAAGLWLVSQTTYPFARTTCGGALIVGAIAGAIAALVEMAE
jgi:hypothetical protein